MWFDQAVTGRGRVEIGIPEDSGDTFRFTDADTVDSVARAHRDACEGSPKAIASLGLDDVLRGHRIGPGAAQR
ncbi:hypothetical protein [Terrabacter terrigena]|uniref:Uncharacterized protein n=1 Tax=Terrabacter terrigena TaxID=574718 RepID=A0ABW3MQQ7_9MICO